MPVGEEEGCAPGRGIEHRAEHDCMRMTYSKGSMNWTLDPGGDLVSGPGRPDTSVTDELSTKIEPRVFWHRRV